MAITSPALLAGLLPAAVGFGVGVGRGVLSAPLHTFFSRLRAGRNAARFFLCVPFSARVGGLGSALSSLWGSSGWERVGVDGGGAAPVFSASGQGEMLPVFFGTPFYIIFLGLIASFHGNRGLWR